MAFEKSEEYWKRKIRNIKDAITGTAEAIKKLTVPRQIEAHEAQIESYKRNLAKAERDFTQWKSTRRDNDMIKETEKPTVTEDVKSAVNAYLLARTYAETHRTKVDAIQRKILTETDYYTDEKYLTRGRTKPELIRDPKDTFLMGDNDHIEYLLSVKQSLIQAGYELEFKPDDPPHHYFCPALVAESLQRDAERLIIETAADMLGEDKDLHHRLLCAGLEKYHEFIDLVVKMVVSMPDFKAPSVKAPNKKTSLPRAGM